MRNSGLETLFGPFLEGVHRYVYQTKMINKSLSLRDNVSGYMGTFKLSHYFSLL